MEIIVNGLFDMSKDKNYVIVDKNTKNELGNLEVKNGEFKLKMNSNKEQQIDSEQELVEFLEENNYALATEVSRWYEFNPNPKGNNTTDCTLRAYCAAENIEWDMAFDLAAGFAKEISEMMDSNKVVDMVLCNHFNYEYEKLKKDKQMTVKEFCIAHPKGTYILKVPRHVVAIVDGEYKDSWDSGDKKVKGIWYRN